MTDIRRENQIVSSFNQPSTVEAFRSPSVSSSPLARETQGGREGRKIYTSALCTNSGLYTKLPHWNDSPTPKTCINVHTTERNHEQPGVSTDTHPIVRAWDISLQTDSDQSVLLEPFVPRGGICLRQLKSDSGIPFSVRSKTFVVPMASIRMLKVIRLMSVTENLWLQHADSAVSQMMDSLSNAKLIM